MVTIRAHARLAALGVYGFDTCEPVIMAALVTGDPLLLIGRSGTGKTYLLNTLSEALGLEHRHYNASLIAFDDLVGFPYPDDDRAGITFLQTPATVWGAESVLIDEISRCRPEHQNRLFSLIHERRLQGIALPTLRYRWAAMNPCPSDRDTHEDYTGSEPLDPALADRFALFVRAAEWSELNPDERLRLADAGGEGRIAPADDDLRDRVTAWRATFEHTLAHGSSFAQAYASAAATALNAGRIRVSPRRVRLLARSLVAASIVAGGGTSDLFKLVLGCSLPHATWGEDPDGARVAAAHQSAWDVARQSRPAWVHEFMAAGSIAEKLRLLLAHCTDPDEGTQVVSEWLANATTHRAAAFAFAVYPAAVAGRLPIGADAVEDLGRIAGRILAVDAELHWQERLSQSGTTHPQLARLGKVLATLKGARRERAHQFFSWCTTSDTAVGSPAALEADIDACVRQLEGIRTS
ncbi:MAG: AAA family ATPase [Acidobacteria bacterium]|nr:AAA family ATPase [Acidobacteriota bacterium]